MTDSRKEPTEEREGPVDPAIFDRPDVQAKIARALRATRKEPTEEELIAAARNFALFLDTHDDERTDIVRGLIEALRSRATIRSLTEERDGLQERRDWVIEWVCDKVDLSDWSDEFVAGYQRCAADVKANLTQTEEKR